MKDVVIFGVILRGDSQARVWRDACVSDFWPNLNESIRCKVVLSIRQDGVTCISVLIQDGSVASHRHHSSRDRFLKSL